MRDTTSRIHSETKFSLILKSHPEVTIIVNQHGLIVFANTQTEKMFGFPLNELLNHAIEILLPQKLHHFHLKHRELYLSNPQQKVVEEGIELFGRRKDGSEFPIEISLSPL